ncbi:MAG: hypothetical protein ABSH05_08340 [Bryobacteraceae bacterium]
MRLVVLFLVAASAAFPQKLSFGLKAGHPFEDVFKSGVTVGSVLSPASGRYTIGPTLELHLPHGTSVELDVLYRPAKCAGSSSSLLSKITASEWRIPLLLKYRLRSGLVAPYVAAGPALRRFTGVQNAEGSSSSGVAAAAGLEGKLTIIRLSGELRYMRWGSATFNSLVSGLARLNRNQVEALVGITF